MADVIHSFLDSPQKRRDLAEDAFHAIIHRNFTDSVAMALDQTRVDPGGGEKLPSEARERVRRRQKRPIYR